MCSHIVSSILNHLLFDISSGILSGMNLAVYLEYTHILTYYIVGHSIWQSYLKYMLAFYLTFYLTYTLTFYLTHILTCSFSGTPFWYIYPAGLKCGYGMLCWNFETLTWQVGNPWICHLLIGVINIYQPVTVRGIILPVPSKPHARQTVIIHLKQPYFGRVTCIYSIIRDVAGFGCDQIHPNIHCPINSVYFHLKTQFTCTHKITLYMYIYIYIYIYMYIYIYVCTYLSIPSGSIRIIHKPENS